MNKKKHLKSDSRRDFIKKTALGLSALSLPSMPVFAGPFVVDENGHLIPEDKKLSKEWIKSLYERGIPDVFTASAGQLKHIGFPVGGIGCGQLYLGGDGKLWLWHIFKTVYTREKDHGQRLKAMSLGGHYAYPDEVFKRETRSVNQGAAIKVKWGGKEVSLTLDQKGFKDIQFRGEYPIGKVAYRDEQLPITIDLEAFSPFLPTKLEDSALPVTVMSYKIKNTSEAQVEVDVMSWLENAVLPYSADGKAGLRRNTLINQDNRLSIHSTAEALDEVISVAKEDIVFEDFESGSFKKWKASGDAFGKSPLNSETKGVPVGDIEGNYYVSSFNVKALNGKPNNSSYPYGRLTPADALTGTLTSKKFKITHDYITFLISGGYHPEATAFNLIIDGKVVRTQTGDHSGRMIMRFFDVRDFIGKKAQLQILDNHQGIWGSIAVDHIVFTDKRPSKLTLEQLDGYGSMALSLYNPSKNAKSILNVEGEATPELILKQFKGNKKGTTTAAMNTTQIGALGEQVVLQPGEEKEVTFLLSWYFPYLNELDAKTGQLLALKDIKFLNKHYNNWFNSASQVADYVCSNAEKLIEGTRLWNKTYYDSTLPYWLLDRSFVTLNCLATNTLNWFDNGRIWGWEGVECCPGTCQHVWQYAQAAAHVFPQLERTLREMTDLGYSFDPKTGATHHRDETAGGIHVAHDGHCGTIMRMYREHKKSPDNKFLKKNYSKIKKMVRFMINEDKDKDGILEGKQQNTLDAAWYGPMGWISSLYIGALAAGKEMAVEVGDSTFANTCDELIQKGRENIVKDLFNGEYFIHKADTENHPRAISSNDGCHIDQVLGQSFAHQIGISERVVPEEETKKALESIWKYNFAPDAFDYQARHKHIKGVRIYATQGEAGTIMTTWPKGGDEWAVPGMDKRPDKSERWQGPGGYFDETMNGFEYQVATHMIWEGMLEKGLATARAVHDRYNPLKRNPYNEIECSDHYSRSMASYGVLTSVCGFDYHGPKGYLKFNPQLSDNDFKAPFTAAEGWGTFVQKREGGKQINTIDIVYGSTVVSKLEVYCTGNRKHTISLEVNGQNRAITVGGSKNQYIISWDGSTLKAGDRIQLVLS